MRYFVELAYDGTAFFGFQKQKNQRSVQGDLEIALSKIYNCTIETKSSSRTDTGVHALQNYCHFDTEQEQPNKLVFRLNQMVGKDVVVKRILLVEDEQHGRFDATARTYHYHVHFLKDPFKHNRSYRYNYKGVNIGPMNEAAKLLLEYTEYDCFCKANTEVKTKICQIEKAVWEEQVDGSIQFTIVANRFLRGMVRAIVGTLLKVGDGQMNVEGFRKVIESKDRQLADFSPPGHGLYLAKIDYPYING